MENSEFNPYCQWLDLPAEPQDFYGLLGLKPFESDTELIRRVSLRLTSTVRNIKPGDHTSDWMKLLDQIEQAQQTLCDPNQKSRYDRALRETGASRPLPGNAPASLDSVKGVDPMAPLTTSQPDPSPGPSAPGPSAPKASPPKPMPAARPAVPPAQPAAPSAGIHVRKRVRRPKQRMPVLFALVTVAFAVVSVLILSVMNSNQWIARGEKKSSDPTSLDASTEKMDELDGDTSDFSESDLVDSHRDNSRHSLIPSAEVVESQVVEQEEAEMSEASLTVSDRDEVADRVMEPAVPPMQEPTTAKPLTETAPSPTAAEVAQLNKLVANGHLALNRGEFATCDTLISQARQLPLDDRGEGLLERLATLHDYVVQYHQAIEEGLQGIEGQELTLNETIVYVVEVNDSTIVLRMLGRNRRLDRNKLPTGFAMAIADRWFDQKAASTKVFKGAFMAVNSRFSDDDVRAIWSKAAAEGVDLGDLMLVLDDRKALQSTTDTTDNQSSS